ncbi:50S ribosomal protein L22 [Patescibacteria group bacterium]|nr:50S ribosomal protein L22 [Patescibacteria group bacterium]
MKASIANYGQSPRKTRLVTDLVKGKTVKDALVALTFLEKRAADPVAKLIRSALANAEKQGEDGSRLYIKSITVNKGLVRVKFMPRAFGRASPIRRRMSHVAVELGKR